MQPAGSTSTLGPPPHLGQASGAPTPAAGARHRLVLLVSLLGTVVVGMLVAVQSRVNGEVATVLVPGVTGGWRGPGGDRVAAGLDAAVLSFGIGWVVLVVTSLLTPRGRRGLRAVLSALRHGRLRWWQALGGTAGAAFVAAQGIAVPVLGVAVFTVACVAGLTVGSLLVDRLGLSPNGPRPFTVRRVVGCLLAVAGVALSVSSSLLGGLGLAAGVLVVVLVVALALAVGAGTAAQQAVNGHVAIHAGSPWTAGLVNFSTGLAVLLPARLLLVGTVPPAPLPTAWWSYLSGPIGMSFIILAALLVRTLGVLLLSLGNTAGQLVGSITLDELLPTEAGRPGVVEMLAALLIFAAVVLAASRPRRSRGGAPTDGSAGPPVEAGATPADAPRP
ncbi:DMT family transporter [Aquipuribacter hungaricus]|uniref:DMT family transporter n=1 Tax=Aquipuribacter hungaricus TaxID=545624 RepID=A0ABV7WJ27_9MICO